MLPVAVLVGVATAPAPRQSLASLFPPVLLFSSMVRVHLETSVAAGAAAVVLRVVAVVLRVSVVVVAVFRDPKAATETSVAAAVGYAFPLHPNPRRDSWRVSHLYATGRASTACASSL